jgi:hypothetical protein
MKMNIRNGKYFDGRELIRTRDRTTSSSKSGAGSEAVISLARIRIHKYTKDGFSSL